MPGILNMNSGSDVAAALRDGESRKRDHDGKLINGSWDSDSSKAAASGTLAVNGGDARSMSRMDSKSDAAGMSVGQSMEEPPEISHIAIEAFHPLSVLLERIAQQCFNELNETLSKMNDIPIQPQTNGVLQNGTSPHTSVENDKANVQKKMMLIEFAKNNRAKFIKLLVMTDWGIKSSKDIRKLIDLYNWTREQDLNMEAADYAIDSIKRNTGYVRENNPDITTALEILSTGKADWMPSLGYITPEPISSQQALKLLRYMNSSLSIRLNLHETLPRHLRNWRISTGRATFIIDGEFEFDVISFVEDTSDQWLFIDLRLLFAGAPTIAVGSPFFMTVKNQADFILRDSGLSGLFDFLHNFVLTHKIAVLRTQAVAMLRSGWAGNFKVEPVHRELVVQYWADRPGKKNWIEIGITTNKTKKNKNSWRGKPIPSLTTRWFRQGMLVKDVNLDFDWKDLSMERMIKHVIAVHTADLLRSTRVALNPRLQAEYASSEIDPTACMLKTSLGNGLNSLTLSLETITGNYILQPATSITSRAEYAINQGREPAHIGNILTQVLAQSLLSTVQKFAQHLGWKPVARQSLNLDLLKAAVPLDILQYALYSPQGWPSKWAFAAVVDSSGESWWTLELGTNGSTVQHAEEIRLSRPDQGPLDIDRNVLASLERLGRQIISMRMSAREVEKQKKSCQLTSESQIAAVGAASRAPRWALHLQTADLLKIKAGEQPWLEPIIAVTYEGRSVASNKVFHIASGRMVKDIAADMQKLMSSSSQTNFSFAEDGHFKILLSTPFGESFIGELSARLRDVNRLRAFATTLQKRKIRLDTSSLQRVQFSYGPSPYTASLNFSSEKQITIEMSPGNPHYRLLKPLTAMVNDDMPFTPADNIDANGLDRFAATLIITRPLMSVFRKLNIRTPGNVRNPAIHVHSMYRYRITYDNPVCTFDIRLTPKDDELFWSVEDCLRSRAADMRPASERAQGHRRLDTLNEKLKEVFRSRGEHWYGTRNGMVAKLYGIRDALEKLDKAILSCKMEGGYIAPPPLVQAKQQAPQQPQQQAQQPNGVSNQPNGIHTQQQAQAQAQAQAQQAQAQQAKAQAQAQAQARMQQAQQQNRQPQQGQGQPRRPQPTQAQQQAMAQARIQQQQQMAMLQQQNGGARPTPQQMQQMQQMQQQAAQQAARNNQGRPGQSQSNVIEID